MLATAARGNPVFSAEVCLMLEWNHSSLPLSTVEPDRFVLTEPQRLDGGNAVLVITVNGEPRRTPIRVVASTLPVREYAYTVS